MKDSSLFRSFELIRRTSQPFTGDDPGKARDMNSATLVIGGMGTALSGISEPKYIWESFISNANALRRRLLFFSDSHRKKINLRKLFLRFLWDEISNLEMEALILLSLEEHEELVLETLKVSETIPRNLLRARVSAFSIITGGKPFSLREFLSSKSFFISVETDTKFAPPSSVKKYTGWKRHQNDQGSLLPDIEEPLPYVPEEYVMEFNINMALTVGIIQLKTAGEGSLTMALMNAETVRFNTLVGGLLNDPK